MSKTINVLVFPAGEINSVELHDALATNVNVKLYGAASIERHGPFIYKNYIGGLPLISEADFMPEFAKLIEHYKIDVIFPTHDTVAKYLVENASKIKAKIIAGDEKTVAICRDKQKTYDLFKDCDFVPKLFQAIGDEFPLFVKPRISQGSVGAKKISSAKELGDIDPEDYIISEYLPGDELTVDCFTDRKGDLKVILPRSRDRLLAGVSVRGQTVQLTNEVEDIAATINQRLRFSGLWYFQVKQDKKGRYKLLEISTRVAGNMGLARATGANLALMSVYNAMGYDTEAIINPYQVTVDRTLINRYSIDYEYENVYFDFDDTLLINGKVHLYSIMFLYQCKNEGKKIFLLTRHERDIHETLKKHKIDPELFDAIEHLSLEHEKYTFIKPSKAIFVDNAFKERKTVHQKFSIPVFDVDTIEVLLDWRT